MTSDRRAGFALPAVLAVTGVVTLIFLVAITALASLSAEARSTRERARFMEQALSAEATVQYMALTEPFGTQGIVTGAPRNLPIGDETPVPASLSGTVAPVFLDGRAYETTSGRPGAPSILISLRDQAGMINLAALSDDQRARLGAQLGLGPSLNRNIEALYRDYVDDDDLQVVNGAESAQYDDQGPPNRAMLRPSEFLSLLGVREELRSSRWRAWKDDLAVDQLRLQTNLNTASARSLEILFGVSTQQAEAAVEARDSAPFLSMNDFVAATGANVLDSGEQLYTFPSGQIVYSISDNGSAWRYRARIVLTPNGNERPFWIDQTEMTEASGTAKPSADADRFPYTPR